MKKILLLSLLVTSASYAQELPTASSRRIEPVVKTVPDEPKGSLLFPEVKENPIYKRPSEQPKINLRTDTDLLDPGERFNKKSFSVDGYAGPGFKSDTFLGEIRTGKAVVEMICRDHQYEDGDLVRVWLDDEVLVEKIYLRNVFQGFNINLKPGFNKLEIEALNQGSSGPNTAQFKVMDKEGKILSENIWNLASGVKATLIVIKE